MHIMTQCTDRTIHLVDIENLLGNPRPCQTDVESFARLYECLVAPGDHDHIVVACNHGACLEVGLGWPGPRLLARSGPDGADRALLEVIDLEEIEERFTRLVVASGDGGFTDVVSRLAGHGLGVTVVAPRLALSKRLRMAAQHVRTFEWPSHDVEAA
jgi:hypothetical protein